MSPHPTTLPNLRSQDKRHTEMHKSKLSAALGFALLLLPLGAQAATLTVRPGGVPPAEYPDIQSAVNAASPGDTILVFAGTYPGNIAVTKNNLHIIARGQVTITGGGPTGVTFLNTTGDEFSGFGLG